MEKIAKQSKFRSIQSFFIQAQQTSSARLRARSALSRKDRTSELLANYLFEVKMLFTSQSVIPILSRLLNNSYRSRVRISYP